MIPLIRSLLFAPANERRKTDRLSGSMADAVVLDLEDAVAGSQKVSARAAAVEALGGIDGPLRYIRVNPLTTAFGAGDIAAVVCPALQAIVLPKVEHPRDLEIACALLAAAEEATGMEEGSIALLPLIETTRGVTKAASILDRTDRLAGAALGTGDLGTDLGLPTIRGDLSHALHHGRAKFVYDARAAGLGGIVDGPCLAMRDAEALQADCQAARDLGFTGKVCIHPDQVSIANAVFAPLEEEVTFARKVVAAFEVAERNASAAIDVDGIFVDYPILYKARRIAALAKRIDEQSSNKHDRKDPRSHG